MRFGVLGPVEVWDGGGRRLPVGGPQQRALLAVLLLNANRMVSADRLVDSLWGADPPETARSLLQGCVAGLRRALRAGGPGGERLQTVAPGYRLRVEVGELDLDRFEQLAAAAGEDPGVLAQALGLWRGPALDGIQLAGVRVEATRLEERRLAVWERRIELDLRLGRHDVLIPELRTLVEEYPLRERLWAQLMQALFRADRRAEALDAYLRLRQSLVEQLGVEPGTAVRELHRTILAEPGPERPEPAERPGPGRPGPVGVPAQLPAGLAGFVGRAVPLKLLAELVADPADGLPVGVISGPAGVGKTSLAVHWAHAIRERFPDGQLYADLRGFWPAGRPADPAEVVRGFLDALGVPSDRVPATPQAQAGLYRSLLADRRVLVVLDNAAGTEQLRPLLPGSASCLVLVTSRNRLPGLAAAGGARGVPLELLPEPEARQLLARRLGPARVAAEPPAVARILARCAGLPLALAIVAARAAAQPEFPLAVFAAEIDQPGLDPFADGQDPTVDLRAVFACSYRALRPGTARLFRLLGLPPGPELGTAAAASLAGAPAAEVRSGLVELVRASLLVEAIPGRYTMHDLLRAYATELIAPDERQPALHRLFDHYLHTAHAADQRLYPFRLPMKPASPEPGVTPAVFDDDQAATDWFATELPVLLATIERAAADGMDRHAWRLAWLIAGYLDVRVRWRELASTQHTALAAAQRLRDPTAEAGSHRTLGRAYTNLGEAETAEAHLLRALRLYTELRDHRGQAHTHHVLSMLLGNSSDRIAEAIPHLFRALELHRALSNESGMAGALNSIGWCYTLLGEDRRALPYCVEAIERFRRCGSRRGEADAWDSLGHARHGLGEYAAAADCYERAITLFRVLDDRYYLAESLDRLGDTQAATGQPDRARAAWQEAVNIFDELTLPEAGPVRAKLAATAD